MFEVRYDVLNVDLIQLKGRTLTTLWLSNFVSFIDDHEDEDAVVNRISWVKLISVNFFL